MHRLTLDVYQANQSAFSWYSREGFGVVSTSTLYEKPVEAGAPSEQEGPPIRLLDWAESQACQKAYGFSRFRLVEGDRTSRIGRLGAAYFRIEEPVSPRVEAILAEIDPARRLLLSSPCVVQDAGYRQVAVSYRMQRH
jgi:hypothetical protein